MLGGTLLIVDDELDFHNTIAGDFTAELRLAPPVPEKYKTRKWQGLLKCMS